MLITSIMIKLGHIKGNKMVDMQLTNRKLLNRAIRIIMSETGKDKKAATELLTIYGSVRKAIGSTLRKSQ
jgi:N-acetylmuramic acid 6-phosphate etherase